MVAEDWMTFTFMYIYYAPQGGSI